MMLVDAVQAAKFTSVKKSQEIIKKLSMLTSVHQADKLNRRLYVEKQVKSVNESVLYTEEVYLAYKRPAWSERKRKKVRKENELSLEAFETDRLEIASSSKSLEAVIEEKILITDLHKALDLLKSNDRDLIVALFWNEVSDTDYAELTGVSKQAVNQRKMRILKKIENFL